jgi:hypothetical protein
MVVKSQSLVGTDQTTGCICLSYTTKIRDERKLTVARKISAARGAIKGIINEKNSENPKKVTATHPLKEMS